MTLGFCRPGADVRNNAGRREAFGPAPRVSTFCGVGRTPIQGVLCETACRASIETDALPSGAPDLVCFLGIL